MGMTNIYMGSLRYDHTGRKRKKHAANRIRKKPFISSTQRKPSKTELDRIKEREEFNKKYPSLMEQQMKDGTFGKGNGNTAKKEPMRYTGTLVKGIATMHKSNMVPVSKNADAKEYATMRRN